MELIAVFKYLRASSSIDPACNANSRRLREKRAIFRTRARAHHEMRVALRAPFLLTPLHRDDFDDLRPPARPPGWVPNSVSAAIGPNRANSSGNAIVAPAVVPFPRPSHAFPGILTPYPGRLRF